jgi:hypothetical protein
MQRHSRGPWMMGVDYDSTKDRNNLSHQTKLLVYETRRQRTSAAATGLFVKGWYNTE